MPQKPSINVFGVHDRTGLFRPRSLSLTHFVQIRNFSSAGVRHGQRQSAAAFFAFRRRKPDGLLVAVSSEIEDSFHAPTSPCLQYALSINAAKAFNQRFRGA